MIGFGPQSVKRRPVYSAGTGAKLGYLVSGPDGEWWTSLNGRRIGRIKKFRTPQVKYDVLQHLGAAHYVTPAEVWQELGE